MNRVVRSTIVVASLVFTLGAAASWGQVPNNDVTDPFGNTAGGSHAFEALYCQNSSCTARDNTAFGDSALRYDSAGAWNTA